MKVGRGSRWMIFQFLIDFFTRKKKELDNERSYLGLDEPDKPATLHRPDLQPPKEEK